MIIEELKVAIVVQHIQAAVTFNLAHRQQCRALQGSVEQAPPDCRWSVRQATTQPQAYAGKIKRLRRVQV
ncbi:hypothetical protein D3C77_739670 [compost metagenome]